MSFRTETKAAPRTVVDKTIVEKTAEIAPTTVVDTVPPSAAPIADTKGGRPLRRAGEPVKPSRAKASTPANPADVAKKLVGVTPPLWSSVEPLKLTLILPHAALIQARDEAVATLHAGKPSDYRKQRFAAVAEHEGVKMTAEVSLRGNASLQDYSFPKLRLHLNETTGPFAGAKRINIATMGMRKPTQPHREAAAYQVIAALGGTTTFARAAFISVVDQATGKSERHPSLLVEDKDAAAKRLGKIRVEPADIDAGVEVVFAPADIVRTELLQAILGNSDWKFAVAAKGIAKSLWNVDALTQPGRKYATPLLNDFDRSAFMGAAKLGDETRNKIENACDIQAMRHPKTFETVRQDLVARTDAAFAALDQATLPDADRKALRDYLTSALATIRDFECEPL